MAEYRWSASERRHSGRVFPTGSSHASVLMGRDSSWRVLIVANGQVRCDARYRALAIVVRTPGNLIQKIDWSDRTLAESEGDALLVVRAANNPAPGVVLFLQGQAGNGNSCQFLSGPPASSAAKYPPVFFPSRPRVMISIGSSAKAGRGAGSPRGAGVWSVRFPKRNQVCRAPEDSATPGPTYSPSPSVSIDSRLPCGHRTAKCPIVLLR
jgi:hypothetical protein